MRTDYFDDLLPDFVTTVTSKKPVLVTPGNTNIYSDNSSLDESLPVLPVLPPKTGYTEVDETIRGIPLVELRELAGNDWPELQNDPGQLESFAHAIQTRHMRESGLRPAHYTQRSECVACGPVWLWKGAPRHVEACPWCFNRHTGITVPRPSEIDR